MLGRQLAIIPLAAMAASATIAPRIEIYTLLACFVHKPDIFERTVRFGGYPGFPTETSPYIVLPPVFTKYGDVTHRVFSSSASVLGLRNSTVTAQPNLCASDPVVQAAVAKLTVGEFGTLDWICLTPRHTPFGLRNWRFLLASCR
jgi:hypothetical protein